MNATIVLFSLFATFLLDFTSAEERLREGKEFHCCTIVEYPTVYRDNGAKYNYSGLAFDYLQELEHRIPGTKCISMYEYKKTFTQFTKDMYHCTRTTNATDPLCKCELGVGGWMPTRERLGNVLFPPNFARSDDDILTHIDNTTGAMDDGFFISAFTVTVWLLIGGLFLLFTFIRMLDARFEQPPVDYVPLPATSSRVARARHFLLKSRIPYRLRKAAFRTAMEMAGQVETSSGMHRDSTRQSLLTLGVMMAGLFLVLVYESSMTARMVSQNIHSKYQTKEDIQKCRIPFTDICVVKGGAEQSYWKNSFAREPCINGSMPLLLDSYSDITRSVASKKCKFVIAGDAQTGEAVSGEHCASVVKVGEPVFHGGISFVMPIASDKQVFESIRNTTFDLVEQGRLKSFAQYYRSKGTCAHQPNDSISFQRLRMFFYVAFAFIVIMFVFMVLDPRGTPDKDNHMFHDHRKNVSDYENSATEPSEIDSGTIDSVRP